jgi:hypothetical protein
MMWNKVRNLYEIDISKQEKCNNFIEWTESIKMELLIGSAVAIEPWSMLCQNENIIFNGQKSFKFSSNKNFEFRKSVKNFKILKQIWTLKNHSLHA